MGRTVRAASQVPETLDVHAIGSKLFLSASVPLASSSLRLVARSHVGATVPENLSHCEGETEAGERHENDGDTYPQKSRSFAGLVPVVPKHGQRADVYQDQAKCGEPPAQASRRGGVKRSHGCRLAGSAGESHRRLPGVNYPERRVASRRNVTRSLVVV
jgi:hypothetical protein